MRISYWSSVVCSYDLFHRLHPILGQGEAEAHRRRAAARVVKPEAHPLDTIAAEVQLVLQAPGHHEVHPWRVALGIADQLDQRGLPGQDRQSTRLNSSH